MTGHAAAGARSAALAPIALTAHALAAAFWAGSLRALHALLVADAPDTAAALRRFSRAGMVAVAVLLAAGVTFTVLQLPSAVHLVRSEYGWLILGKAALLIGPLVLASLNRYRFLPRFEHGDPLAGRKLRRSIAAEFALVACVMAITGFLVQTPPPRDPGFAQTLEAMGHLAELSVSPARAGRNRISVRFRDAQGRAFDPEEVAVNVGNPSAGVEPIARPMRRDAPGEYSREGDELVFGGTWTIEVQARIGDFDRAIFRGQVPVR